MDISLCIGSLLVALGYLFLLTAVFRDVTHRSTYGLYEVWVLPVVGLSLLLAGGLVLH